MSLYVCNRCGERQESSFACGMCGWGDMYPVAKKQDAKPVSADAKSDLRIAQQKLRDSKCTCSDGKHDPFWVQCERTKAEILVDEALAGVGVQL